MDLQKFKDILTYKDNGITKHYEIENSIKDEQLITFIKNFRIIFGTEFYTQQSQVVKKIMET